MNEIPTRYNPKEAEEKWYKFWEEKGCFHASANPRKKPFSIVIPPPNVTGILHMGHALNNTIQDILIRYHRGKGEEALWIPGTDHAGIATQNVVEKSIAKEGKTRQELGREKFIQRVWRWREEYGSTIIKQLKRLGASCDWSRERFTMDEEYSKAVMSVFIALWNKNLIYQDDKVINWCPRCQTALSDEEAPHRELDGELYYLRYPLKDTPGYIVVATTRPETMLGDTGVAVNPKDKRYKKFIGRTLALPLANREIKIIADSTVDMKFGTGAVKVTPAHDPNDYALGKKHKLKFINIMHSDGRMNENAGEYSGMDRFEAREVVLEDLKENNLLEKVEPHRLSAGHCYRCHTIIEPYLSRQWFVKMKPLAKPAIEAVKKGKIKFHPSRWTKVYLNWMENIQDWCISRQIWWGHRIPLWYCFDCKKEAVAGIEKPRACRVCGSSNLKQDEDVLDTWFSSWLWPFATFKSEADLKYFYPTAVLVTAPEIIFFWVARMIMAGFEFMKKEPFRDVYIHGTVRDVEGKKMSKSLGNIIDPLEIIGEYGADALRFSLISITAQGQDVYLSKERFEQGRNFANKIWNASRFILMNLDPAKVKFDLCVFFEKEDLNIVNRWILSRFYSVLKETDRLLKNYKFNEAANALYAFFWHEFCDWYLEIIKPEIKDAHNQLVMFKVLEKFLRLLHPFMPFITEEIWQRLAGSKEAGAKSIINEPLPHLQEKLIDKKIEQKMDLIFEIIAAIRNIRHELGILLIKEIPAVVFCENKADKQLIEQAAPLLKNIAKLASLDIRPSYAPIKSSVSLMVKDIRIAIPLEGLVDIEKERQKIAQRILRSEAEIRSKEGMLENRDFLRRAPGEVVEREKAKLTEAKATLKRLEAIKDELR